MAIQLTTITNSIAAVTVAGVDIKDVDEIPEAWDIRKPALFPRAIDFVTDLIIERDSFGTNANAKKTLSYRLHYTFCYAPVGAERVGMASYGGMVTLAMQILDAFDAAILPGDLTSSVDALMFGPVADAVGKQAIGCEFEFMITEFIN